MSLSTDHHQRDVTPQITPFGMETEMILSLFLSPQARLHHLSLSETHRDAQVSRANGRTRSHVTSTLLYPSRAKPLPLTMKCLIMSFLMLQQNYIYFTSWFESPSVQLKDTNENVHMLHPLII